jgi:hypothetical protein
MVRPVYVAQVGSFIEFPDDASDAEITSYLKAKFPTEGALGEQAAAAPAPPTGPDESSILGRFAYGVGTGFTDIPGGIAALGLPAEKAAQTTAGQFSEEARKYLQETFGIDPTKDPTAAQQAAQALGSVASFLVPGSAVAKGVSLAGKTAAAAGKAATVTAGAQGVALGAEGRAETIRNQLASGMEISEEQQLAAQRLSGLIGASEALPIGRFFGPLQQLLSKIPVSQAPALNKIVQSRLGRITRAGAAEGAQEVASGIANDIMEYGIYNPDVEIGQDILSNAGTGAFAGSFVEGVIQLAAGRKLRPYRQLQEDLAKESAVNAQAQRQGEISRAAEELRQFNVEGDVEVVEDDFDGISRFTIRTPAGNTVGDFLDPVEAEEAIGIYKQRTDAKVVVRKPAELPSVFPAKINGKEYQTTDEVIADRDSLVAEAEGLASYMSRPDVIKREAARQNVSEAMIRKATEEEVADMTKKITKLNDFVAAAKPFSARDELGEAIPKSRAFFLSRAGQPVTPEAVEPETAEPEAPIGAAEAVSETPLTTEAPAIVEAPEPSAPSVEGVPEEPRPLAGPLKEAPAPRRTFAQAEAEGPILRDYNQATIDRYAGIYTALKSRLSGKVPKDVDVKLEELIGTDKNLLIRGQARVEKTPNGIKSVVDLSTGILRPDMTVEQAVAELAETLNHEIIHVLRDQGVIRPAEWKILSRAAVKTKVPGRSYTYLDKAQTIYTPGGRPISELYTDPDAVIEEAVAEMYKDWVKNKNAAELGKNADGQNSRGLFNRITEFFRSIFRVLKSNKYQEIFKGIDTGEIGAREGVGREATTRFSASPARAEDEDDGIFHAQSAFDQAGDYGGVDNAIDSYRQNLMDTMAEKYSDKQERDAAWAAAEAAFDREVAKLRGRGTRFSAGPIAPTLMAGIQDPAGNVDIRPFPDVNEGSSSVYLRRDFAKTKTKGRVRDKSWGEAFDKAFLQRLGRQFDINDPIDYKHIVASISDEIKHQMQQVQSGVGWYDSDIQDVFDELAKSFPILKDPAEGPVYRQIFTLIAGVMSNGMKAKANVELAAINFAHFLRTGQFSPIHPFTNKGWNQRSNIMGPQIAMLNSMVADAQFEPRSGSNNPELERYENFLRFMFNDHSVREINQFRARHGTKSPAKIGKLDDRRLGMYAFGPKFGPFILNLNGLSDETVDSWASRSFYRHMGRAIGADGELIQAPFGKDREAMKRALRDIAAVTSLSSRDIQAVLWFYEKELFNQLGQKIPLEVFSDGAREFTRKYGTGTSGSVESRTDREREISGAIEAAGTRYSPPVERTAGRFSAAPIENDITWTPERIDREIRSSHYGDGRSKAYVAWINPESFLGATATGDEAIRGIINKYSRLYYNKIEKIANNEQSPFLIMDGKNVVGHEGRHRMAALSRRGITYAPVVVLDREGGKMRERIESLTLGPQGGNKGNAVLSNLIPLNEKYRTEIEEAMAQPRSGMRFSAAPALSSEEFKRWFRNSKAVNPDGTPQRWLHGTPVSFKQFGKGRSGSIQGEDGPFFFSQSPEFVEDYSLRRNYAGGDRGDVEEGGRTIPVYLSVQNPFDYKNPRDVAAVVAKLREMHDTGRYPIVEKSDKASNEVLENRLETLGYDLEDGDWPTIEKESVQRAIRELGYDSFFVKENKQRNLAVYRPEQVKSIFNQFEEGAATSQRFSAAPLPPYIEAKNRTLFVPERKESIVQSIFDFFSAPETQAKTLNTVYGQIDMKGGYFGTRAAINRRMALVDQDAYVEWLEKTANEKEGHGFQRREANQSALVALGMARRRSQLTASSVMLGGPTIEFTRPGDIQSATVAVRDDADKLIDIFRVMLQPGPVDPATNEPRDKRTIFKSYATAMRAIGLKAAGKPVPRELDDTYINTTIQFTQQNYPEIVEAYKSYQRFNKKLLTAARDAGRITNAELAKFTQQMDYYGFNREVYEEQLLPGAPSRLAGDIKIREYKGSQDGKLIEDPMLVILSNVDFWMGAITHNIAVNKAFKLAKDMGEARLLGASEKPDLSRGESEQVMFFRENGVLKRFAVKDPMLVMSLGSDDRIDMGKAMNLMGMPTSAIRETITRDPAFMVANLLRDTLSSWITSGEDITPFIGTAKGFASALKGSASFQALMGRGVVGSHDLAMRSPAEMAAIIRRRAMPKNILNIGGPGGAQNMVMSLWDKLGVWSEASDAATRIAVYEAAIKNGMSEAEAAFRAIEIMNFSRRGSSGLLKILTQLIPFLNARIQGMDVLYQAGKAGILTAGGYRLGERDANLGKKFLVRGAMLAGISLALEFMLEDDEDYKELPDYVKNSNLLIPLKWLGIEGGYFAAVPKPFEAGLLFSTIPQEIYKAFNGQTSTREGAKFFFEELVSTFGLNPIPQVMLPALEVIVNHDFYTGLPLISEGKMRLTPELQYDSRTSTVARMLGDIPIKYNFTTGKFEGVSPIVIDQLVSGYGGPMGSYIMQGVGMLMEGMDAGPERLPRDITQLPMIKRFLLDAESRSPKSVAQAYELFRVVDEVNRSFSRLRQTGDTEAVMDYLAENKDVLSYKKYIYKLFDGLNKISARERQIERDETMTRDEKFEAMRKLREVRARLTSQISEINKKLGR